MAGFRPTSPATTRPPPAPPARPTSPPPPPPRLVRPRPGLPAELPAPHDLGADPLVVLLGDGVVEAPAATWLPELRAPHRRAEVPLVQARARVPERFVGRPAFAGGEAVE